jgi:hypothetical protein
MNRQLSKTLRSLKKRLLEKGKVERDVISRSPSTSANTSGQPLDTKSLAPNKRDPYFIQIGFDFGTSYSKCICRDMMTNKAWVHLHSNAEKEELPFLIPSLVVIEENRISHVESPNVHYPKNGLYHLKNALMLAGNGQMENPLLAPYRNAVRLKRPNQLSAFVVVCAVYFLSGAFGEIRNSIRNRFPGFGVNAKDYMAINLAIPVENAQQPMLNKLYRRILCVSWSLADRLSGYPAIHLAELHAMIKKRWRKRYAPIEEACFTYPEVSANVQAFVRSRVSSPGLYLFSDTGGGTVDQSAFIFTRRPYNDHLTYLTGRVLPLGSSRIEQRAAEKCGKMDCLSLEKWRAKKERGEKSPDLEEAKVWIARELGRETKKTVAQTSKKLFVKKQLNDIRIIFGGGGNCEYPYKSTVTSTFLGLPSGKTSGPDVIGMPIPNDLALVGQQTKWMRRLSVAYGLSFEKGDLAPFTFPRDVSDPRPNEIWQPHKKIPDPPTKDDC